MNTYYLHCLLIAILYEVTACSPDYYWRDYFGRIPEDAVPGGRNLTGGVTFIGQSFVINQGLLIGPIIPGSSTVVTSKNGIYHTDNHNKILCSRHTEAFIWRKANYKTLHDDFLGQHLVKGGVENGKILSIGREAFHGEMIIGKVLSFNFNQAFMYFVYENVEYVAKDYEILVYEGHI